MVTEPFFRDMELTSTGFVPLLSTRIVRCWSEVLNTLPKSILAESMTASATNVSPVMFAVTLNTVLEATGSLLSMMIWLVSSPAKRLSLAFAVRVICFVSPMPTYPSALEMPVIIDLPGATIFTTLPLVSLE